MALLSRVADRIYWAGRYIERAEDASRVLRSFGDMLADIPATDAVQWSSLRSVAGAEPGPVFTDGSDEMAVVEFLVADPTHHNSIVRTVESCRENLRTCREVLPREAWQTVNDLALHVRNHAPSSLPRLAREALLTRVINESRRLDGVLTSTMTRDEAYEMWRLGRFLERADMTTRVLGVRAATLLSLLPGQVDQFAEVRWMSVLRSLSALQMYQRASAGTDRRARRRALLAVRPSLPPLGRRLHHRDAVVPAAPAVQRNGVAGARVGRPSVARLPARSRRRCRARQRPRRCPTRTGRTARRNRCPVPAVLTRQAPDTVRSSTRP